MKVSTFFLTDQIKNHACTSNVFQVPLLLSLQILQTISSLIYLLDVILIMNIWLQRPLHFNVS